MRIEDYTGLVLWKSTTEDIRARVRTCLTEVAAANRADLVDAFYHALMMHPEGANFLNHNVVEERLRHSLGRWIDGLVSTDILKEGNEFAELQTRIGLVHARIKVPNHLVIQGASLIKSQMAMRISGLDVDREFAITAIVMLDELIDYATNLMGEAYVTDTKDRAKADEAFRLFSLGQDINLERETQRAALMEWSQQVLLQLLGDSAPRSFAPLSASRFGLWVRHRAAMLFQGSPMIDALGTLIETIDGENLRELNGEVVLSPRALTSFQQRIDEIKFILSELFQGAASVESGRDPLTRTLNRRFLPSVLSREVAFAQSSRLPLTVALIDVDHFKRINDVYGHAAGDVVLSHVADTLLGFVRASDYVFRYGGEEFLIAFAETDIDEASRVAERLRRQFSERPISIAGFNKPVTLTVSVGVARFEGHPDYDFMVRRADEALYRAKNEGRDRVVCAM